MGDATPIRRDVLVELSQAEAGALLWAVRQVPLEKLQNGPYHGQYDQASGHGALSSAANRVESMLALAMRRSQ
jgi:hypothetical protein